MNRMCYYEFVKKLTAFFGTNLNLKIKERRTWQEKLF